MINNMLNEVVLEKESKTIYEGNNNKPEKELQALKKENFQLKTKLNELLKLSKSIYDIDNTNKRLIINNQEKDKIIKDLNDNLLKSYKENKEEKRINELELLNRINFYKGLYENGIHKIDGANKILLLNESQHNFIIDLEKKIQKIKEDNIFQIKQMEISHERQYSKLKKKMMNHIKNAQKEMAKKNIENIEINTKFNVLEINQMKNELENLSLRVEELLETKDKDNKTIALLTQEAETHKKVVEILQQKNNEYLAIIKEYCKNWGIDEECLEKKGKLLNNIKEYLKLSQNENNGKNNEKIYIDSNKKLVDDHLLSEKLSFNNSETDTNTKRASSSNKYYEKYIKYEKLYYEQQKEINQLKDVIKTLKEKERNIYKKYNSIFTLYQESLENLTKDIEIKDKKYICLNTNKIKNCEFDDMNNKEKFAVLALLIKHILPVVLSTKEEIDNKNHNYNEKNIYNKEAPNSSNIRFHNEGLVSYIKNIDDNVRDINSYKFKTRTNLKINTSQNFYNNSYKQFCTNNTYNIISSFDASNNKQNKTSVGLDTMKNKRNKSIQTPVIIGYNSYDNSSYGDINYKSSYRNYKNDYKRNFILNSNKIEYINKKK